jgi:putative transposase
MPIDENRLSHCVWECKYHVVWIPKCRRKAIFGSLRKYLGEIFHELARQKECRIAEGHVCVDHVHMLIEIPPKHSVSQIAGFIKGKSAIAIARNFMGKRQNFTGQSFWARGYYVSTVGRDEDAIKEYIQGQEKEDSRLEQLELFKE